MQIISTNIAKPTTFIWNGNDETTVNYKNRVDTSIFLGNVTVKDDEVSDRKEY